MATDCTNFTATGTRQDVDRESEYKGTPDSDHEHGQKDRGESDGDETDLWGSDPESGQEQQNSEKEDGEELWEPESGDSIFSDSSDDEEEAGWSSSDSILDNANRKNVGMGRPIRKLVVSRQKEVDGSSTQLWDSDMEEEDKQDDSEEVWDLESDESVFDKASEDDYSCADELSIT